jgi:hypothetical protein
MEGWLINKQDESIVGSIKGKLKKLENGKKETKGKTKLIEVNFGAISPWF